MQTVLTTIVLTALLFRGALQASTCGVGKCISCRSNALNTESSCTQCSESGIVGSVTDFTSKCEGAAPVANCLVSEMDSSNKVVCNCCSIGYYANTLENSRPTSCVKIPTGNDNCIAGESVSSTFICTSCVEGFSLESGKCAQVTHDANCRYNGQKGYCAICKEGFAFATNSNTCEKTPFVGCSRFDKTKNNCIGCDFISGYYVIKNELRTDGSLHQICAKLNVSVPLLGDAGILFQLSTGLYNYTLGALFNGVKSLFGMVF